MKTLPDLEALSNDELRVMLAKLAGFDMQHTETRNGELLATARLDGYSKEDMLKSAVREVVPNYPIDLNGVHEVEKHIGDAYPFHNREWYRKQLRKVCNHPYHTHEVHATARQRAIALILTLQQP